MSLLLKKILSFKEKSPLITILDDAAQSATPVIKEFLKNAAQNGRRVVYLAFEGSPRQLLLQDNPKIQIVRGVRSINENPSGQIHATSPLRPMSVILQDVQRSASSDIRNVIVIIDSITPVFLEPVMDPIHFLGSLLSLQLYSVVLTHHTDILLPSKYPHYPSAQTLLSHISTTVLRVSSVGHHKLKLEAESQALPDPVEQDRARNGVISTVGSNSPRSIIVSFEYRKKSGRTILERNLFNIATGQLESMDFGPTKAGQGSNQAVDFGTTFNLGISDRQRQTKDELVLPHFAAQKVPSADSVDRVAEIEYTLDAEDDFDDEEDVDEDLLI